MNVIKVNNLVKRYKGAKTLSVDHISFAVRKGEFLKPANNLPKISS